MASAGPSHEPRGEPAAPLLHSIREADARHLGALCELLVGGEQNGGRCLSLSWPSGVRRGMSGEVEPTGAFEDPNIAVLWRAVAPLVAHAERQHFTDLQVHLNNAGPKHTDQGDVPPSALLVFGCFGGGAFHLTPLDEPEIVVHATQHVFEFDGRIPHSVDDIVASPSGQIAPRRWSIVCHTRCHSADEEADLHARALVMADIVVARREGLTGVRALMPDLSRESSLAKAISQAGSFTRRYAESDLDAGVREDTIFQERNEALASSLDPSWRHRRRFTHGSLFSGFVDGFGRTSKSLGLGECVFVCDSDPNCHQAYDSLYPHLAQEARWGNLGDVSSAAIRHFVGSVEVLSVTAPCGDHSVAGARRLRRRGFRGQWLLLWTDVLRHSRPPILVREFIYNRSDPEFLEELAELESALADLGYLVADSSESVFSPHEFGGAECRQRLLAVDVHCAFFDAPHVVSRQSVPPDPVVPADFFDPAGDQPEELRWSGPWKPISNKEVLDRRLAPRAGRPLLVGTVAGGGLGGRIFSDQHSACTVRSAVLAPALQPLGPAEALLDSRSGTVRLANKRELSRIRGFSASMVANLDWSQSVSMLGRALGATQAVVLVVAAAAAASEVPPEFKEIMGRWVVAETAERFPLSVSSPEAPADVLAATIAFAGEVDESRAKCKTMSVRGVGRQGPLGLGTVSAAHLWLLMRSYAKDAPLPPFDTISAGPPRLIATVAPAVGAVSVLLVFGPRPQSADGRPTPTSEVRIVHAVNLQRSLSIYQDAVLVLLAYRRHGLSRADRLLELDLADNLAEQVMRPSPARRSCESGVSQSAQREQSWQSAPPASPWLNYQHESLPDQIVPVGHSVAQSGLSKRKRAPVKVRYDIYQQPIGDHHRKAPPLRPLVPRTALRRTGSEALFGNLVQQTAGLPVLSSVTFDPSAQSPVGRPRLGSVSSVGSGCSDESNVTTGTEERRIRVDASRLGGLIVGDDDVVESGWPRWSIPGISSCLWRVVSVGRIPAKGRLKSLLSDFAQRAVGHSVALAVVPVEVHTAESAVPVLHLEKKSGCVDVFTELAVRLDMSEEFLRRTLISRPDLVELISQTQSRGRDPKLEEFDGSDPNNFVETLHFRLASVNQVTTTDPLPVFAPNPPWTGGVVTIRDLIPKRSDRERIAKMQRALLTNGIRAWTTGGKRRRSTPLVMPPSVIDPRYLAGGRIWCCHDPENCVPLDESAPPRLKVSVEGFKELEAKWGCTDQESMSQICYGMRSFADSQPLGIVASPNYESLTPHYPAVWKQSLAEAAAGDSVMFQVSEDDFDPDRIRLLTVPALMDSTGAVTKKHDLRVPPKARRTTGKGSPESRPHFSSNYHMNVRARQVALRLPTIALQASNASVLFHPARAMGESLTAATTDFLSYFTQFGAAHREAPRMCYHLVSPPTSPGGSKLTLFRSLVSQFGGANLPFFAQNVFNILINWALREFDLVDRPLVLAEATRNEDLRLWLVAREGVACELARSEAEAYGAAGAPLSDAQLASSLARHRVEQQRLLSVTGYVDDKEAVAVGRERAFRWLVCFLSVCLKTGVKAAPEKSEIGRRVKNLGFYKDYERMIVVLLEEKRDRLVASLLEMLEHRTTQRAELESLAHTLVGLCFIVEGGRRRIGRLFRALGAKWSRQLRRHGDVRLVTSGMKEHLSWWIDALKASSGCAFMCKRRRVTGTISWASDASWSRSRDPGNGLPGVAGFLALGPGYYWHEVFSIDEVDAFRIHHLEMYGAVQNTATFGRLLKEHGVESMMDDMDNEAVAHALLGSCPKDPILQELFIYRLELADTFGLICTARHVPGIINVLADLLSRQRFAEFNAEARLRGWTSPVKLEICQKTRRLLGQQLLQLSREVR